jgi:hypothetical protein
LLLPLLVLALLVLPCARPLGLGCMPPIPAASPAPSLAALAPPAAPQVAVSLRQELAKLKAGMQTAQDSADKARGELESKLRVAQVGFRPSPQPGLGPQALERQGLPTNRRSLPTLLHMLRRGAKGA